MLIKIKHYYNYKQLLKSFVVRDLKSKYLGSAIGLFWSVLDPIFTLILYTFVFAYILKIKFGGDGGLADFALYLFCALLPWLAIQESIQRSMGVIPENANLIKKMVFPARILPTYIVVSSFVGQLIGTIILVVAIMLKGYHLSLHVFFLPIIFIIQFFMTMGVCLALASVNVFIRDTSHLVGKVLMVWMYVTPIVYPLSIVPEKVQPLFMINPIMHLVDAYREVLLNNSFPDPAGILFLAVFALIVFKLGDKIFKKTRHKFADVI